MSFGARMPLMDWAVGGTFTRASVATSRNAPGVGSTIKRYGTNERRFENGRFLSELQAVYACRYSEDLTQAVWVKTNCTISADEVEAPDGTVTADRVVVTTGGIVASIAQTGSAVPTGNVTFTFWIRGTSSFTCSYTLTSTASVSGDFSVTTEWKQVTARTTGTVTPVLTIRPHAGADTATVGNDIYVWGVNIHNSSVAPSYVTVTSANITRSADSLTYAAGSWNTAIASQPFSIEWCPNTDSGGLNSVIDILCFGASTDRLSVSNVDSIQVIRSGVIYLATGVFTYSRDQVLTFTFRPADGQVTVAGATTGNGTFSGSAWAMPTAVTLRAGGRVGSTAEVCGSIGNPYPA